VQSGRRVHWREVKAHRETYLPNAALLGKILNPSSRPPTRKKTPAVWSRDVKWPVFVGVGAVAAAVALAGTWQNSQKDLIKRNHEEMQIRQERFDHRKEASSFLAAELAAGRLTVDEATVMLAPAIHDPESFTSVISASAADRVTFQEAIAIYLTRKTAELDHELDADMDE
jgi:hypothetical protein